MTLNCMVFDECGVMSGEWGVGSGMTGATELIVGGV